MCAITGGCRGFSIPAPQHRREKNDQNSSEILSHRNELSGPGVWDCTKGYYVYYIFSTTLWYFNYLPWEGKSWSEWSTNGNAYRHERSRRNRRVGVRRKVSMLAEDMMESHCMGKHWGKCCLPQDPGAGLQETVDSWSFWKLSPKASSLSPVQRTQETQYLAFFIFHITKLCWWEGIDTHSSGSH